MQAKEELEGPGPVLVVPDASFFCAESPSKKSRSPYPDAGAVALDQVSEGMKGKLMSTREYNQRDAGGCF